MPNRSATSGKAKPESPSPGTARDARAGLIRKKEAKVTDGALQVVIAVASVTSLVTVDTTQDPPAFDPADLGSLTFGNPRVGLTDEGVAIFKANLKVLLPQIAGDIEKIADNANLNIGEVAKFVQLSLLTG